MSSEFEFLALDEAIATMRDHDPHGWRQRLLDQGWRPVAATRTHFTFDDDDPCAPTDLPELEPELWLTSPAGDAFCTLSMLEGHLCAEMLTTLENGARLLTVLMNEPLEKDADNLVPWEEAGNYLVLLREGGLDTLVATHAAEVARMVAAEGAAPGPHASPDDITTTKRNNNRHADNWGWGQSLGAFVPPELPHEPEDLKQIAAYLRAEGDLRSVDDIVASLANPPPKERASNLAQRRLAMARDERLRGLMVARHSLAELATWPVKPATAPGRHALRRNWTDDEEAATEDQGIEAMVAMQRTHLVAYVEALAEVMGQPRPAQADLERYADATVALMLAGAAEIDPDSQEASDLVEQLQHAAAALPWIADVPDHEAPEA